MRTYLVNSLETLKLFNSLIPKLNWLASFEERMYQNASLIPLEYSLKMLPNPVTELWNQDSCKESHI